MKLAVVILNWNGQSLLEQFLPTIIQYSPEATIYVADNASTDNSVTYVKANFPSVKIIINKANYGFAGGYNESLQNVDADLYALVNSDIEVTANWLEPIIETFKNEPKTAIIQPKILDFKNKEYFEYAGAAGGFIDKYGFPFCRGRIFDTLEKDNGQYDNSIEIFWASGACFFIRSEIYHELNGFDSDFFAHQEEIDLCWRLKNAGKKIFYTGKSTVYHVGGGTLNKQSAQKTFLNMRNNLTMLVKNLPVSKVFWIIFTRLILDGAAALYFAFKNGFPHLWAVLRAHFSFYAQLPKTLQLRSKNQIRNYYQSKWLIFKHFI